jgi:hypothetical protein
LLGDADPTGAVSDLPAIFSADLAVIETLVVEISTAGLPSGSLPTDTIAEIPTLVSKEGSLVLSDFEVLGTHRPSTLALTDSAVPSLLVDVLPEFGSDLEDIASTILLDLSKGLASASSPAHSTASSASSTTTPLSTITEPTITTAPILTTPLSTTKIHPMGGSSTASQTTASFTGAATTVGWKTGLAGVVGFAAVVILL